MSGARGRPRGSPGEWGLRDGFGNADFGIGAGLRLGRQISRHHYAEDDHDRHYDAAYETGHLALPRLIGAIS